MNKENKTWLRILSLVALLALAVWLVYASRPRDLGRELRYATFRGDGEKVERLLRAHPELVDATFSYSAKNQPSSTHKLRPGAMNITDEFSLYVWNKFVMKPIQIVDKDDRFLRLENEMLTPLQIAIVMDQLELVRRLLDHGANVHHQGGNGYLAVVFAASKGPEMMKTILAHGGRVDTTNYYGTTPLHGAVSNPQTETLKLLLQAGADPNVQNRGGWTPLHNAVMGTFDTNVYVLLLQHGARLDITNRGGKTPLDIAREYHRSNAVEFLSRLQP